MHPVGTGELAEGLRFLGGVQGAWNLNWALRRWRFWVIKLSTCRAGSIADLYLARGLVYGANYTFLIIPVLAQQDVRSILANLVSNVIWELGKKLGTVVKGELVEPAVSL